MPVCARVLPAQGSANLLRNATVKQVAESAGKTAAQVLLRWHLQRGVVVIPKVGARRFLGS